MIRLVRRFVGLSLLAMVAIGGLLAANLWTFHRLTAEQAVANLHLSKLADGAYAARLTTPDGLDREFVLHGDEWQLDVRLISWSPWLFAIGRDPMYRLDRLSGRYRDVEMARKQPLSAYAVAANPGLDMWSLVRDGYGWLPGVDAAYGAAVFLPMSDGASYRILLTPKAVIARADNGKAREAISQWN